MTVLALDIGTSGTKVGIVNEKNILAIEKFNYEIISKKNNNAELDVNNIWKNIKKSIIKIKQKYPKEIKKIQAISTSSLGEAVASVDRKRKIIANAMLAYDERGSEYIKSIKQKFSNKKIYQINGNFIAPIFSLTKIMWIKKNCPEIYQKTDKFLLLADCMAYLLGAEAVATNSLANRTMMFNIKKNDWDEEIINWAKIEKNKLPKIVEAGQEIGVVNRKIADEIGLPKNIKIFAGAHDQCCNALAAGAINQRKIVVGMGTYETYCPVFKFPENINVTYNKKINIEHHIIKNLYVAFLHHHSGLIMEWFIKKILGIKNNSENIYEKITSEINDNQSNILFLPHTENPQWPKYMKNTAGIFIGIKNNSNRADMFKAVMEGIAFYFVEAVNTLKELNLCPDVFVATGGGAKSDKWLQIKADVMGVKFQRLENQEASLTGAAMIALVKSNVFNSYKQAVENLVKYEKIFVPNKINVQKYKELYGQYKKIYPQCKKIITELKKINVI